MFTFKEEEEEKLQQTLVSSFTLRGRCPVREAGGVSLRCSPTYVTSALSCVMGKVDPFASCFQKSIEICIDVG